MAGRTSEAQEVLETLTLRADSEYVPECLRAQVYLGLGQTDKAFESLERAVAERFDWPVFMAVDPRFDVGDGFELVTTCRRYGCKAAEFYGST